LKKDLQNVRIMQKAKLRKIVEVKYRVKRKIDQKEKLKIKFKKKLKSESLSFRYFAVLFV
jgi:hypothetical protein